MNYDHDDSASPGYSAQELDFANKPPKTQRHSRIRWKPEAISIDQIKSQCSASDASHRYLVRNGLTHNHGYVFSGKDMAGIPCHGAYVELIFDKQGTAVNAMFKVQNTQGIFEDLLVPNAPFAGCYSRIGSLSPIKVVVVDHASGLAINEATGLCVAVAHCDENLEATCSVVRERFPDDEIIIAVGTRTTEDMQTIKKVVVAAALTSKASIAMPANELTFAALLRSQGSAKVKECVTAARCLTDDWTDPDQRETESSSPLQWPHPVHPGGLLAAMCAHLSRFTVLPFSSIYAMVLWILGTHLTSIFSTAPVLALLSLTRRCGKSVTLLAVSALVRKVKVTSDTTAAGLFEMCDDGFTPALDEGDQFLQKRAHPINAVINSGHTRIASKVTRKGKEYQTFCFKLIAAIGTLPNTIMDRSIVILLFRKNSREKVERYKESDEQAAVLRTMIKRFVSDRRYEIQHSSPELPEMTNDRALNNWEPLFAIASCAGPDWLKNAHEAALELTPDDDDIPAILEEFICDTVAIFLRSGKDFIATSELIKALCKDEEKPWAKYSRNERPLSIHDLGKLMREAKVKVGEQKHDKDGNRRGYYRKDVAHLFDGYGPTA